MMAWGAAGLGLEVGALVVAAAAWLRGNGYTLAEAGAVGVMVVFVLLSLSHQVDFFIGSHWPGMAMETAMLGTALWMLFSRQWQRRQLAAAVRRCFQAAPAPALILAAAWTAMAGLVLVRGESADLLLRASAAMPDLATHHPIVPLNAHALFYHATRFGIAPAACGMGILAHMATGLATYALARRYAWPPMAPTVALVVLSMPRLVLLGMRPTTETLAAAAAAVAMLLLFRLLEQHRSPDLWLFLLTAFFAIGADPMSLALVLVLLLLLAVVMTRRHGWLMCRQLVTARPCLAALMLLAVAGTAQMPVFLLNLIHEQPVFGAAIAFDTDGIIGAAANLLCYLLVSVDPTQPLVRLVHWLVGLDLHRLVMGIDRQVIVRCFGEAGAAAPFAAVFSGSGRMGFGPVAPLLILPALGYGLVRGNRRLKAVGVAWAGYLYLAALVEAWQPGRIAVLTPLLAANGVMVAFCLPPWRLRRRGRRLLQTLCALLLAGSLEWTGTPPAGDIPDHNPRAIASEKSIFDFDDPDGGNRSISLTLSLSSTGRSGRLDEVSGIEPLTWGYLKMPTVGPGTVPPGTTPSLREGRRPG